MYSRVLNRLKNLINSKLETLRISRIKGIFEHGFLPNWSEQIYKIHKINNSTPVTYILEDLNGEIIIGSFYNEELLNTSQKSTELRKFSGRRKSIENQWH